MDHVQPTAADVLAAETLLRGVAIVTPILSSSRLNRLAGGTIHVKAESLQHTGAFKFRGAYNCMARVDFRDYPDGVLAYSTGNHGQAIATVGKMLGVPTTVVMPSDAPSVKIEKARAQGARVVFYDRATEQREEIAAALSRSGAYVLVPPGDHRHVIAGQGTVALEALRALHSEPIDIVMVPCGGGGLAAGTCLAVRAAESGSAVWAAEPHDYDDTRRSMSSQRRETNDSPLVSVCDALLASTPAVLPFSINQRLLSGVLTATDQQVLQAMKLLYEEFALVVEPGGAVAIAALLANPEFLDGRTAIVIASGGNVDAVVFSRALAS